ncbi:MAG: prolyl oligopeptidase family serine peptidase [Pseudomonadota bacterium]
MKRIFLALMLVLAVIGGALFFRGEALALSWRASAVDEITFTDLVSKLDPHITVSRPDKIDGLLPIIIQMHGCGGLSLPRHAEWADIANEAGFISVIVDSNRPRGFGRDLAMDTVCQGKALLGQERAADILAAYDIALSDPQADPDRVYLAGWSHGAWSIMDFMTMGPSKLPAGLRDYDGGWPSIEGLILFYPHCGLGALSRVRGWQSEPDTLAFIAGADTVVNHKACLSQLAALKDSGLPTETIVYADAQHGFDNAMLPSGPSDWYNDEHTNDAKRRYRAFLKARN